MEAVTDLRYPLVARDREPEFDTTELHTFGRGTRYLRRCLHANALPVVSCDETVAHLCIDCDVQLPAWWKP